jgi:MFS family permease
MNAFSSLVGTLMGLVAFPILLLNFLAPLIGGIWLATLGEWRFIGIGVAYMLGGTLACGIAMLPGLPFAAAAASAAERGKGFLAFIVGLPALLWTLIIACGSCAYLIHFASEQIDYQNSAMPYMLWALSFATTPWDYLAMKDQQASHPNDVPSSGITATFLNMGCIAAVVGFLFFERSSLIEIAVVIAVALAIGQMINLVLTVLMDRERQRYEF